MVGAPEDSSVEMSKVLEAVSVVVGDAGKARVEMRLEKEMMVKEREVERRGEVKELEKSYKRAKLESKESLVG